MPKILYIAKRFGPKQQGMVDAANTIIDEYIAQGFDLTLRQLFYQFVSRDLLPNTVQSYKNLGTVINDARLAGLIDWNHIVDRTRYIRSLAHWNAPADIVEACAYQFRYQKWADQAVQPEVWIEKDALIGVIEGVCNELDVPYFSCRGYTSQSEMWAAAQRFLRRVNQDPQGQHTTVLHLGDHDPSGIDMSRDIEDRIRTFMGKWAETFELKRLALNMNQIDEYNPPPNPAKTTDSRAEAYIERFGDDSWELDALDPVVLANLIRTNVEALRDEARWKDAVGREKKARETLRAVSDKWNAVTTFVNEDTTDADT